MYSLPRSLRYKEVVAVSTEARKKTAAQHWVIGTPFIENILSACGKTPNTKNASFRTRAAELGGLVRTLWNEALGADGLCLHSLLLNDFVARLASRVLSVRISKKHTIGDDLFGEYGNGGLQ